MTTVEAKPTEAAAERRPRSRGGGVCSPPPRSTRGSSAWWARSIGIWIAFHILSGGDFLTSRNLWNLSVQSTSIAIMATGMVLIIVSRNIDLSVGSLLGFLGYTMALVQTDGKFAFFGVDVTANGLQNKAYVWIIALAFGLAARRSGRQRPGLRHRLCRRARIHRHARRLPRLAWARSSGWATSRARRSHHSTRRSS